MEVKVNVAQSYPRLTLHNPVDYRVHGIFQDWILERVAFPFSGGSSQLRNWTRVSSIAGGLFTNWAIRQAPAVSILPPNLLFVEHMLGSSDVHRSCIGYLMAKCWLSPQNCRHRLSLGFSGRDSASGKSTCINPALRYSIQPLREDVWLQRWPTAPFASTSLWKINFISWFKVYLQEQPFSFAHTSRWRAYVTNATAIFRHVCCSAPLSPPPSYLLHGNYSWNLNTPAN